MKNPYVIAALAALMLPFAALAEDDNIQLANATGYGTTVEEARKAAVRSAVEAVVGSMVDAETLVENDELVQNVIDTYSNGTATDVKMVGEPAKTDTGLWKVRVQAKVKKAALVEKLKTATRSEAGVEGESLYQRMVSARQNLAAAETVMEKLFAPERVQFLLKAQPDNGKDGTPIILDDATGEVAVRVKCWVDMVAYKQWIDEILEKLGPMAVARHENVMSDRNQMEYKNNGVINTYELFYDNSEVYRDTLKILCNLRAFKVVSLLFDKDKTTLLEKTMHSYHAVVKASLLDKTGEEIKIVNWPCDRGTSFRPVFNYYDDNKPLITPTLCYARSQNEFQVDIPFGKMAENDIKDIDRVVVEVQVRAN